MIVLPAYVIILLVLRWKSKKGYKKKSKYLDKQEQNYYKRKHTGPA